MTCKQYTMNISEGMKLAGALGQTDIHGSMTGYTVHEKCTRKESFLCDQVETKGRTTILTEDRWEVESTS